MECLARGVGPRKTGAEGGMVEAVPPPIVVVLRAVTAAILCDTKLRPEL